MSGGAAQPGIQSNGGDEGAMQRFAAEAQRLLSESYAHQKASLRQAADLVARTVERGGIVHLFGTGHSHLLAEEIYSRAGGLMPVNVLESAPLMLHEDAVASGQWERLSGVAAILLEHADIDPYADTLVVISNSGVNAAPVEAAEWAAARGMPVIALTSLAHSRAVPSRASSGKKLYELATVVLDNFGVPGDALVEVTPGLRVGATSDTIGAFLLHTVVVGAVAQLVAHGIEPPVLLSANVPEAHARNQTRLAQYAGRLPAPYHRLRERARRAESALPTGASAPPASDQTQVKAQQQQQHKDERHPRSRDAGGSR